MQDICHANTSTIGAGIVSVTLDDQIDIFPVEKTPNVLFILFSFPTATSAISLQQPDGYLISNADVDGGTVPDPEYPGMY